MQPQQKPPLQHLHPLNRRFWSLACAIWPWIVPSTGFARGPSSATCWCGCCRAAPILDSHLPVPLDALHNFQLPLLKDLRAAGYQVEAIAPHDSYTALLQAEGFSVHNWLVDLLRIYQREQPALVHHFTIKACFYGTIAWRSPCCWSNPSWRANLAWLAAWG